MVSRFLPGGGHCPRFTCSRSRVGGPRLIFELPLSCRKSQYPEITPFDSYSNGEHLTPRTSWLPLGGT
jgi:hypothetical protein